VRIPTPTWQSFLPAEGGAEKDLGQLKTDPEVVAFFAKKK